MNIVGHSSEEIYDETSHRVMTSIFILSIPIGHQTAFTIFHTLLDIFLPASSACRHTCLPACFAVAHRACNKLTGQPADSQTKPIRTLMNDLGSNNYGYRECSSQGTRVSFIHERERIPMREENKTTKMRNWFFHHEVIIGENCGFPNAKQTNRSFDNQMNINGE